MHPVDTLARDAAQRFRAVFAAAPDLLARAPGRVEILGNHTDHNGGLVLAAAIHLGSAVPLRTIPDAPPGTLRIRAENFRETLEIHPDSDPAAILSRTPKRDWKTYALAVLLAWREQPPPALDPAAARAPLPAAELLVLGNVPIGAGLSSSASFQVALALALLALADPPRARLLQTDADPANHPARALRLQIAKLARRAENRHVGVPSGLLDQAASLLAAPRSLLFLDCADESNRPVPLGPRPPAILLADSGAARSLADGMYAIRRAECQQALDAARALRPELRSLSELAHEDLPRLDSHPDPDIDTEPRLPPDAPRSPIARALADALPPAPLKRALHVLRENDRVRAAVRALDRAQAAPPEPDPWPRAHAELGKLVRRSHESSRRLFENSSPALDALVQRADQHPANLGGKLSGAGWAGRAVFLARPDAAEDLARFLGPETLLVRPAPPAAILRPIEFDEPKQKQN